MKVGGKKNIENFVVCTNLSVGSTTKEADGKEGEREKGKKKAGMKRVDRRRAFLPGCYRSIKQTSDFPSSSSSSRNFAYIR